MKRAGSGQHQLTVFDCHVKRREQISVETRSEESDGSNTMGESNDNHNSDLKLLLHRNWHNLHSLVPKPLICIK